MMRGRLPETTNQCAVMQRSVQVWICAQVFVESCGNVFAVTVPTEFGRVEMIQSTSQATSVDFPIPWPEAVAIRIGWTA